MYIIESFIDLRLEESKALTVFKAGANATKKSATLKKLSVPRRIVRKWRLMKNARKRGLDRMRLMDFWDEPAHKKELDRLAAIAKRNNFKVEKVGSDYDIRATSSTTDKNWKIYNNEDERINNHYKQAETAYKKYGPEATERKQAIGNLAGSGAVLGGVVGYSEYQRRKAKRKKIDRKRENQK